MRPKKVEIVNKGVNTEGEETEGEKETNDVNEVDNMTNIKKTIENLKYNNGNLLTLFIGKSLSNNIFKDKFYYLDKPNYLDLIPLITSIYNKKPIINNIQKTQIINLIYYNSWLINEDFVNGKISENVEFKDKNEIILFHKKLISYYFFGKSYNNHNDQFTQNYNNFETENIENCILLKYYNIKQLAPIQLDCCRSYYQQDQYIRITWYWKELHLSINLDLYIDYFKFNCDIGINENVIMIPNRKKKIWEHLDLLSKIISHLVNNDNE